MNLKETILKEHTKTQRDEVVNWVSSSQQRFDKLFQLMMANEPVLAQRASWAVSHCVKAHPGFIQQHLGPLIENLKKPGIHDAVLRNSTRLLQRITISEQYQGYLMDSCFQLLESPATAIAVKVCSLSILAGLAKDYPEIIPEIKLLLAEQLPKGSAALRSRSKKVLKQLERL